MVRLYCHRWSNTNTRSSIYEPTYQAFAQISIYDICLLFVVLLLLLLFFTRYARQGLGQCDRLSHVGGYNFHWFLIVGTTYQPTHYFPLVSNFHFKESELSLIRTLTLRFDCSIASPHTSSNFVLLMKTWYVIAKINFCSFPFKNVFKLTK